MNNPMKILSVFVLFCSLVVLLVLAFGAAVVALPVGAEMNIDEIAGNIGFFFTVFLTACLASLIAGIALVIRGRKRARQLTQEEIRTGNEKVAKVIRIAMVSMAMLAGLLVAGIWYSFHWNPDTAWAAKVIGEAEELQVLLARYHEVNGEYPKALGDLEGDYTEPTDFLSRNADSPERSRWGYERMGRDDYQLEVTAYSWVSYWDSLVYRSSGNFTEPWFDNRDAKDWRDFGKWRYVKGFSRHDD